jgi:hypothetical protein
VTQENNENKENIIMSTNTLDALLAGGGKTAKFEKIGTSYSGTVISADIRQATNFDTGKPEFWEDGKPKQQVVIAIQTALREDSEDDGIRSLYIKGWGDQRRALQAASKAAGGSPAPGDTFTATYVGDGEKPQRGFAPKIYKYEIKKGSPLDAVTGAGEQWAAPESAAPASSAPAADAPFNTLPTEQIEKLIEMSLTDEQIATALGLTPPQVTPVRVQYVANQSKGF